MELAGTLEENLRAAVASAVRLRDHPVYRDTVAYWNELLAYAREIEPGCKERSVLELISNLQEELLRRRAVDERHPA